MTNVLALLVVACLVAMVLLARGRRRLIEAHPERGRLLAPSRTTVIFLGSALVVCGLVVAGFAFGRGSYLGIGIGSYVVAIGLLWMFKSLRQREPSGDGGW